MVAWLESEWHRRKLDTRADTVRVVICEAMERDRADEPTRFKVVK